MWTVLFHAHAFNIGNTNVESISLSLTKHALTGTGKQIILLSTRTRAAYEPREVLDALNLILRTFQSFPCDQPITESSDWTLSVIYDDVSRPLLKCIVY